MCCIPRGKRCPVDEREEAQRPDAGQKTSASGGALGEKSCEKPSTKDYLTLKSVVTGKPRFAGNNILNVLPLPSVLVITNCA